jgi:hypothetical protein
MAYRSAVAENELLTDHAPVAVTTPLSHTPTPPASGVRVNEDTLELVVEMDAAVGVARIVTGNATD